MNLFFKTPNFIKSTKDQPIQSHDVHVDMRELEDELENEFDKSMAVNPTNQNASVHSTFNESTTDVKGGSIVKIMNEGLAGITSAKSKIRNFLTGFWGGKQVKPERDLDQPKNNGCFQAIFQAANRFFSKTPAEPSYKFYDIDDETDGYFDIFDTSSDVSSSISRSKAPIVNEFRTDKPGEEKTH